MSNSESEKELPDVQPRVDESKKTILIYSPDLNFCFSLSMLFQDRYNVITTTNPDMLATFVAHYAADLAIVDSTPSQKMLERLSGIKNLNAHLPILMLYVYNLSNGDFDKEVRAKVDSVFYKPFDIAAVSKRIEELLLH